MSQPLFSTPPNEICIIRLSAIGDITHMLPIIATLKKEWPKTKITWIIGQVEYQLIKQIEGINFVIFNKSNGFKEYLKIRKTLKAKHFDVLLMMQTSLRASIISLCIKAKVKLGFDKKRAHDYQSFFTNQTIDSTANLHVLDVFFLFLEKLGIQRKHFDWLLKPSDDDIAFAQEVTHHQPYVVINPCSSIRKNNFRNWPNERYAKLIDYLYTELNITVALTGGPSKHEAELGFEITQLCQSNPINMIGKTTLMQLLAFIKGAHFMVAPDTGPAHMATVAATPVIGLYASSNPLRTGPYNVQETSVNQYPTALEHYYQQGVADVSWGKRVREINVMSLISLDDVVQKINALR